VFPFPFPHAPRFLAALRRHVAPATLYLDNGSTYSGDALRLCCERLGITLVHARPYCRRSLDSA
jgi:transposase InsO family protein